MAEEDVVAQHERAGPAGDEFLADQKGLGQALGARLLPIRESQAELRPVAEKVPEPGQVLGRADDQNIPDAGHHQDGKRVIDHRLVIDRQKLLADDPGDGKKPGARAPR